MSVTADLMGTSRGTGPITIHDYGDRALLLEFGSTAEVLAWSEALAEADLLVVPDKMSREKISLLKAFGAEVIICPYAVEPVPVLSDAALELTRWAAFIKERGLMEKP